MKELLVRGVSGLLYAALFLLCLQHQIALIVLFLVFGLIALSEFNNLIKLKGIVSYILFIALYIPFACWQLYYSNIEGFAEATQILHVLTIFVLLFLIDV